MHVHGTRARLAVTALFLLGLMIAFLPTANARPYWIRSSVEPAYPASQPSIALDSSGHLVYAYFYDYTENHIPTLTYLDNLSNRLTTDAKGDPDVPNGVSLALDPVDGVHIAFHDATSQKLTYLYPVPSPLVSDTSTSSVNGIYPSLALDDDDRAWISFYDQDTGDLDYATIGTDLVWHINTIASDVGAPTWSSLVLDASGAPHISYYDSNDHALKYASPLTPEITVVDDTVDAGVYSSLKLDAAGVPHIAYWDKTNSELKYATLSGSTWTISVAASEVSAPMPLSLAFDSSDHPHIAYYDATLDSVMYASFDGTDWSYQTVAHSNLDGSSVSLLFDDSGNAYISYVSDFQHFMYLATQADDSTAPTISGAPQGSPNANGWYNRNVSIHWTCADDGGSGLASCGPDATITSEGTNQTLDGTATDNAGNSTSATSAPAVNIDKTKPTITGGPTTTQNVEGWYTSPVDIAWGCNDSLSGIDTCTEASTLSTEGANQSVSGAAVDKAGNTQTASATVSIDLTGPEISGAPNAAANANGWFKAPVTITWDCNDAVSGITSCQADQTVNTDGANQTTSGSATNGAGLTATAVSAPFSIDQVPPTISGTPSGTLGTNGWYTGLVTINWDCSDTLSTIDTCSDPSTLSSDGADQTASGTATDKAGNTTTVNSTTVSIDQTDPVVTYSGNQGRYTLDQTVNIHCAASDALSGVATTTCADITGPASNFATSTNQFSASATDNAGNTSSASTSFTIDVDPTGLCALTKEYVNNARIGNQLCAPLQLAQMGVMLHNSRLKASAMNSYILLVSTQRGRSLTIAEANTLIALARSL